MADKRDRRSRNVCTKIFDRSQSGASVRKDLNILRTLITSKSRHFSNTWSKTSKNPIGFDNQRLFFDKFRTVYHTNGSKGKPFQLYKLPQLHSKEKVESAVVFESPLDQVTVRKCANGYKPCIFGLTAGGNLFRQDLDSGKILESVYLNKSYKFKHIFWETDLSRVVITSIHTNQPPRTAIQDTHRSRVLLMYLALFEVAPLKFAALIPINKTIFGFDALDASASNGILFVMHQGGVMKLYSLQEILEKFTIEATLGESFNFATGSSYEVCENRGIVGSLPYGIPVNTIFERQPNVLLQLTSHQHFLSFGGYPWHYIASPKGQSSVFEVFTIEHQKPVKNGLLKSNAPSIEQDHASFHSDHSGRILHVGPDFVSCIKVFPCDHDEKEQTFELRNCYNISLKNPSSTNAGLLTTYTSSGRKVKHNSPTNPGYETVRDFDYEDELDMLVVLSSQGPNNGHVGLYDNQTGSLLKDIHLPYWDEDSDHSILMERDTIVHIYKSTYRNFHCHIFKLTN